ncbi:hypothetical protein [Polaromonas sp. AET17H-212]|uniref:hypothetical protein n=1 Tax=Polaromonas sp. AET17H-212 TaxID=1977061 RepID=UPI001C3EF9A2|nr:hypothetical protein [Polaromonas sp. AET17H-212]
MKLHLQESQESSLCFLGIKNDTPLAPDLATRQAASPIWIKVFKMSADTKGFPASASGLGRKKPQGLSTFTSSAR